MSFDFDTHFMTAFYEDVTGGGSKTLLGSVAIDQSLTASLLAADYGVMLFTSSGATGFDNIQLTAVPEPAGLALLGLAGGLLVLIRRKMA